MYLVFDIETTGLVICEKFNQYPNYQDNKKYDASRIVQIAWVVLDVNYSIVEKRNYIVKKDDFNIKNEKFHGISNDISLVEGVKFEIIMMDFYESLLRCNTIVSHNILFDYNVLLNHLYRFNLQNLFFLFSSKNKFCTSYESTNILKLDMNFKCNYYKYPSLQELYKFYFNKKINNQHNALNDTIACADCFTKLKQDPLYILLNPIIYKNDDIM